MPVIDFHRRFHPLTAHPFDREDCAEYPPCEALRPYVRCFWGPVARKYGLVVPDACADIIILPEGQGDATSDELWAMMEKHLRKGCARSRR